MCSVGVQACAPQGSELVVSNVRKHTVGRIKSLLRCGLCEDKRGQNRHLVGIPPASTSEVSPVPALWVDVVTSVQTWTWQRFLKSVLSPGERKARAADQKAQRRGPEMLLDTEEMNWL